MVNFSKAILSNNSIPNTNGHCTEGALVGSFGLILQIVLGSLAFSLLMIKRFREPVNLRRGWKIWFYDTSKQGLGALLIHFVNVFSSDFYTGDPCTWYAISFILDSTAGLCVIYIGLFCCQYIVRQFDRQDLISGNYAGTFHSQMKAWGGQCALYLVVLLIEKGVVFILLIPDFWNKIASFVLKFPLLTAKVEMLLVVLVIPFTVNAIMFWVVDTLLMNRGQNERYYSIMAKLKGGTMDDQVLIYQSKEECEHDANINPFMQCNPNRLQESL